MIKGIHHLNVVVSDVKSAQEFFCNLGFVINEAKDLSGAWIDKVTGLRDVRAGYASLSYPGSALALELLQYNNPAALTEANIDSPHKMGYRHLALEVTDIQKHYDELKAAGVSFIGGIMTNPYGKKLCYFRGPDNIIMELAEF